MDGIDPNLLFAKMGDNNGDDKTLWLFLLLLLYGKDGLGGNGSRACCPPVTLEQLNDAQTALQAQARDCAMGHEASLAAAANALTERTLDITRDQAANAFRNETGQREITAAIAAANSQNLVGQKDLAAAIAQCCCDGLMQHKETQNAINKTACETQNAVQYQGLSIQNAIDKCCCETQNSIAMQTNVLQAAICTDGQKTRDLITQNKIDELQAQLTDQKVAVSNLQQTNILAAQIRETCGPRCYPWHGGGNGGPPFGNGPA